MWQWYWHVLYLQCFAIITSGSAFLVIGYLLMEDYCAGDLFCYILIFPCSRGLLLHSMVHCFAMSRLERESVVFLSLWPWCLLLSFFLTVWFENMLFHLVLPPLGIASSVGILDSCWFGSPLDTPYSCFVVVFIVGTSFLLCLLSYSCGYAAPHAWCGVVAGLCQPWIGQPCR